MSYNDSNGVRVSGTRSMANGNAQKDLLNGGINGMGANSERNPDLGGPIPIGNGDENSEILTGSIAEGGPDTEEASKLFDQV